MHVDRLRRMVALLRRDAADPKGVQFDLSSWAERADPLSGEGSGMWPTTEEYRTNIPVSCGTKACALGLAAISKEFEKEGLGWKLTRAMNTDVGSMFPTFPNPHSDRPLVGFDAGAALFDITQEDAQYFFDPDCYEETPKEAEGELLVARRIEDFIAGSIDHDYHPGWHVDDGPEDEDY